MQIEWFLTTVLGSVDRTTNIFVANLDFYNDFNNYLYVRKYNRRKKWRKKKKNGSLSEIHFSSSICKTTNEFLPLNIKLNNLQNWVSPSQYVTSWLQRTNYIAIGECDMSSCELLCGDGLFAILDCIADDSMTMYHPVSFAQSDDWQSCVIWNT